MSENHTKYVIIIGGGLVGSLCGCLLAKKGFNVSIYEKREDIRLAEQFEGRSINLSLSHRGRKALKIIGLEEEILEEAVPMKGRLIHSIEGRLTCIPYDSVYNQCGFSVSRAYLNKKLLDAAEKYSNVKLNFNHKLIKSNFCDGTVSILNTRTSEIFEAYADLIIGADGAHSHLRLAMLQTPYFQFSQYYIEHAYLELLISSDRGEEMVPNQLHIWPRREFMMIALPNKDKSWTVTLFMPLTKFKMLTSKEDVILFFQKVFPDVTNVIGIKEITEKLLTVQPSSMVSIKCDPFYAGYKYLLIGDAAHAMVPFYGQGMNCGFEDCSVLSKLLESNDLETTVQEFSRIRVKDAHSICDLAMYNYKEMRDLVSKKSFRLRKILDELLFQLFPNLWIPLYWSVSYSDMEYSKCRDNKYWQDKVISAALVVGGLFILLIAFYIRY